MLRPAVAAFNASSSAQHKTIPCLASRSYAHRSKPAPQNSEPEVSAIKQWLAAHHDKPETIPRNIAVIKTSGSVGYGYMGGDTKVTLQITLNALSNHVSPEMVPGIKGLPCYTHASDSLTIRSHEGKNKRDNVDKCFRKVNNLLRGVGDDVVDRENEARLPGISQKRLAGDLPYAKLRGMNYHDRKKYKTEKSNELRKAKEAEKIEERKRRNVLGRRGGK